MTRKRTAKRAPDEIRDPVLVTGATGFIGQRVVDLLLDRKATVRALVLPSDQIPGGWKDRVEVLRGDVTDRPSVSTAMKGAGAVIHLAAVVGDFGSFEFHRRITVEGTEHVLGEAAREKARAVLASSVAVYGDAIRRDVCNEDHPFGRWQGPYSRSKQAQERTARRLEAAEGLEVAIVRPTNVYGPGSQPWVHAVSQQLRSGLPSLVGGGESNAGLAYVDNVADLFVRAATLPVAVGRVYNACDELDVTWKRYFSDLAVLLGAKPPRSIPRPVADLLATASQAVWRLLRRDDRPPLTHEALALVGSHHRVPATRARRELGWTPSVGYREAMVAISEYVRDRL